MDLLNRAFAQLSDVVRSMTPRARITAGSLLAVAIVGLLYLYVVQSRGSQIQLLGGHTFSVAEIHAAQGAFGKAGLNDFEVEGGQITIPQHKHDVFLAAMADANVLPANFGDYMMKTIKEQSPWTGSRLHDQAILAAHQRVLSNSISQMQGIDTAQVFISVLDKANFRGDRLVTASVDVRTIGNRPLDSRQVRAIRSLVAGGTAGLKRHQITVVDSTGRDFPGTDGSGLDEFDEAYFARQEVFEQRFEETVLKILSYVPGVAVSVHVELAPRGQVQEADDAPVELADASSDAAEAPATAPHAANSEASLNNAEAEQESTVPVTPKPIASRTAKADLKPQDYFPSRVTTSVNVPGSYYQNLWRLNHRGPADRASPPAAEFAALREEVSRRIQRHVLTVIPHEASADPAQLVSVTSFDPLPAVIESAAPSRSREASPRAFSNWRVVGLCTIAVVGLLMLRSLLPARKRPEPTNPPHFAGSAEPDETNHEPSPLRNLRSRSANSGAAKREDLADVVRENPDAAANILRTWIGNDR